MYVRTYAYMYIYIDLSILLWHNTLKLFYKNIFPKTFSSDNRLRSRHSEVSTIRKQIITTTPFDEIRNDIIDCKTMAMFSTQKFYGSKN